MPNLEKFPTSASLAIRTSTPNQHAQRENRRRAVVEIPSPHRHRRGATALFRNPVRGAKRMRVGILRILQISRAVGTPLPMAERLTQLAKIISRDLYNRSSAVDSSSAPCPQVG